eukprot:g9034.t1
MYNYSTHQGGGAVATNKLGMRRSCDHCGRRKRKCDGGSPCSRCLGAGKQCTYSKRSWHLPPPQQSRREPHRSDPTGVEGTDQLLPSASGMLSFKRCRLSASPATGLVGMQENSFLSNFFACVGFLPLTTRSHIRETMVNIMARPAIQQPAGDDCAETEAFDAMARAGNLITAFGANQPTMSPSTCIFWCAVALGALVKGYPIESVASYTRLATDSLGTFSGPPSAEVAEAWTILAHLYGFTGNKIKFEEYMGLSISFLDASIREGTFDTLPVGFADLMHHSETIKMCSGNAQPGEIEAFCAEQKDPPQLYAGADERALYVYVTRSFRMFEQAVFAKACEKSATTGGRSEDVQPQEKSNTFRRRDAPLPSDLADAMTAGLEENMLDFERLEETVERPTIRKGIGSLIINGTLVFKKAQKGDADGTLERIARCIEVYEQYPGLCHCSLRWSHIAHALSAALAALVGLRSEELYARLRAVSNPARRPGSPPLPPLEEWQGVSSFCEDMHCRSLEGVIESGALSAFSAPVSKEHADGEAIVSLGFDGQNHHEVLVEGVFLEETEGPILAGPCCSVEEAGAAVGAHSTTQANHCAESSPSAFHSFEESGIGPNMGVTCCRHVLDAAVDASGMDSKDEMGGDECIAAADWVETTHAMLGAVADGPNSA